MVQRFKANVNNSVLILVDVQDKLLHAIHDWESLLTANVRMVKLAHTLGIPIIVTEQYPKGLGRTNSQLLELVDVSECLSKTVFSCFGALGFEERLNELNRNQLIIIGIEAHICVTQTTLDALDKGYNVHVVDDCVGSRSLNNKQLGLNKLQEAGAVITSTEMVLYEWLGRADSPEFKKILPLIK